jgi:hypothetical protein
MVPAGGSNPLQNHRRCPKSTNPGASGYTRPQRNDAALTGEITDRRRVIGFRNILVRDFVAVDDAIVRQTAQTHLPVPRGEVARLLQSRELPATIRSFLQRYPLSVARRTRPPR